MLEIFLTLELAEGPFFSSKEVWASKNMGFFKWEASWRRILTLDQFKRRGLFLESNYYMCTSAKESADHLLIHYGKARRP